MALLSKKIMYYLRYKSVNKEKQDSTDHKDEIKDAELRISINEFEWHSSDMLLDVIQNKICFVCNVNNITLPLIVSVSFC